MITLPSETESLMPTVLVTHSCVPRTEQMTAEAPRLVRKPDKNIKVFVVVGIFQENKFLRVEKHRWS